MSTRSVIGYKLEDGSVISSYCHFDGYWEGVGQDLYKNYRNKSDIDKLISKGDMSTTAPGDHYVEKKEVDWKFIKPNRSDSEEKYWKETGKDIFIEYTYLWKEGEWYGASENNKFIQKLEEILVNTNIIKKPTKEKIKDGMKISNVTVWGWENAILGMRFPMNSEAEIDSQLWPSFKLGNKDKSLILRLTKAGTDHRKILRMIHVQAAVKMPFTWWAHYDTYKVATVAISRSRMHRLTQRLLERDDFYVEDWDSNHQFVMDTVNDYIDQALTYKELKDNTQAQAMWRKALDMLPLWYCQERMIDLNYETLVSIMNSRYKVERLAPEWNFFCETMLASCPHLKEIWEAAKEKRSLTIEEFNKLNK